MSPSEIQKISNAIQQMGVAASQAALAFRRVNASFNEGRVYSIRPNGGLQITKSLSYEYFPPHYLMKFHPIEFILNHVDAEYQSDCIAIYLGLGHFVVRDFWRDILITKDGCIDVDRIAW